jgi:hypothetical protein
MVNVPTDLGERIIRAARMAAALHGDMQLVERADLLVNGQLGLGGIAAGGSVTDDKRNVPLPQLSAATSEGASLRAAGFAFVFEGLAPARHGPGPGNSRPGPFLTF